MKHILILAMLLTLCTGIAQAIEPDPKAADQYGNPEEPAMRPYKWIFHGFKGLVYHPGKSFVDGNMNLPVLGTVEVTRGARRGAVRFGESAINGVLFRSLPEKKEYKELGKTNEKLEKDKYGQALADAPTSIAASFAVGFPIFPIQMLVDHCPMEDDATVKLRQEEAKKTREIRKSARTKDSSLTELERAQRSYVGDRATAGKQTNNGGGNLLKLAE